jgi:Tol biopolymer transport system component
LATVIRSLRTGEERELSTNLNQMLGPVRWFPDGRSLLVGAWEGTYRDSDAAVYRVDVQTDAVSLVTRVGRDVGLPYLAQNGKAILYFQFRKDGPNGLAIMIHQIDTGQAKEIYRLVGASWAAVAISPDGRQVAFVEPDKAKQSAAIKIMPVAGGEPRELLRVGPPESINDESRMEWTPDGRHLLIVRRSSRGWPMTELWRVPVQGGEPQKLGLAMERIRFPSVHPDGRRIAFDAGQWKPRRLELWVMENFLPELKAGR